MNINIIKLLFLSWIRMTPATQSVIFLLWFLWMGNLHRWNLTWYEVRSVGAYATGGTKVRVKKIKDIKIVL